MLHAEKDINRSANRVRAIFKAAGVADHFQHRWGQAGHDDLALSDEFPMALDDIPLVQVLVGRAVFQAGFGEVQ